jgi:hypothetical protein
MVSYFFTTFLAVLIALHEQTSLQRWHPTHLLPISIGLRVSLSNLMA